jgi:hypothetical protein
LSLFGRNPADANNAGCGVPIEVKAAPRLTRQLAGGGLAGWGRVDDPVPGRLASAFWGLLGKGVAMKRYALMIAAALGLVLSSGMAHAGWGSSCCYSGYQPWWNIFACRPKCKTCEEERLEHFWHDYYDALKNYYGALDHMDWVAYYKNHGYVINAGCMGPNGSPCRINYAPVFVSPNIQWAVPNTCLGGPPMGPTMGGPACGGY